MSAMPSMATESVRRNKPTRCATSGHAPFRNLRQGTKSIRIRPHRIAGRGGTGMKLPHRRKFLHLAAGAAALPVVPRIARAQTYPSRPVRLVVGDAAGGAPDSIAR